MPSSVIGALRVTLGLDSAQFTKGTKDAENRAEQMGLRIGRAMRGSAIEVGNFAKSLNGLTTILGGVSFLALAKQGLDYASSLAEISQQLGVTSKDLQEYRYAASQVGISSEEMDKALAKLTVTMGEARDGAAKPVATFKALSELLGKDVLKGAQSAGDAIPLISDALAKVQDPAQRAAFEVALFGKTGQKLDTLLAGGSAGVNQLRDAAQSLGIVLSDKQIADADQTADKLTELKIVLEANIAGAVANNATAIYGFIDAMTALIAKVPAAINALAKFQDYVAIGQGVIREKLGQVTFNSREAAGGRARADAARDDLRTRQNFGKPFFGDKLNASVDAYANRVGRAGAGAGVVGDGGAGKAAAAARRADGAAKRAAEKATRDAERFAKDLSRAQQDQLNAQLDLTVDQTERVNIQQQLLDSERDASIEAIGLDRDTNDEQKRQLKALAEGTYLLRARLLHQQDQEELAARALANAKADSDNQLDVLEAQSNLARTAKERGRIELEILNLQFEQLKAEQQNLLDNARRRGDADAARNAQGRLDTLGTLQGLAQAKVARSNQGPLGQYLDTIPKSAAEVNEALERIQADGLSSLVDGLSNVQDGFKGLAQTVDSVASQIISALARIAIQKGFEALINAFANKGSGGFNFSGGINGDTGSSSFTPDSSGLQLDGARAGGGSVMAGRNYLVGEMGPEIFHAPSSGRIIANDDIRPGGGIVQIAIEEGALFRPVVRSEAGQVSVQTLTTAQRSSARRSRQRLA